MEKLTRYEVLGKCVIVFEAMKRLASKGNAGLDPIKGAEEEFWLDAQILDTLRVMMHEMKKETKVLHSNQEETKTYSMEDILRGNPLITAESIEAARRVDEARDKLIERMMQPEPDAPKVTDLREWQRLAAVKPPERLDFDEDS